MNDDTVKKLKEIKKIYTSFPCDVDTKALNSKVRVQKKWHEEKLSNLIFLLNFCNHCALFVSSVLNISKVLSFIFFPFSGFL